MGLMELNGTTVFLDTAPLIYFIEGKSTYQTKLSHFFSENDKGAFFIITSTLTLLEVLVQPIKLQRLDLVDQYLQILTQAPGIEIIDASVAVASDAARLRATYNLKTPDAIQLATAILHEAKYFLTNDMRLKTVKNIEIVTLNDL